MCGRLGVDIGMWESEGRGCRRRSRRRRLGRDRRPCCDRRGLSRRPARRGFAKTGAVWGSLSVAGVRSVWCRAGVGDALKSTMGRFRGRCGFASGGDLALADLRNLPTLAAHCGPAHPEAWRGRRASKSPRPSPPRRRAPRNGASKPGRARPWIPPSQGRRHDATEVGNDLSASCGCSEGRPKGREGAAPSRESGVRSFLPKWTFRDEIRIDPLIALVLH